MLPFYPALLTIPGIGWVLAFTIAAKIGDIHRSPHQEAVLSCAARGIQAAWAS